jgi:hypothetical protein
MRIHIDVFFVTVTDTARSSKTFVYDQNTSRRSTAIHEA